MTEPDLYIQKLQKELKLLNVPPNAAILVAYSGGPDSTALLYGLAGLRATCSLRIEAFYLDHGLRPPAELADEALIITDHCKGLQVPLHTARLTAGQLKREARLKGQSIEAAAREIRYQMLNDTAISHNIKYIATGHTQDDNLETVIMRFFQGSGTGGLGGISTVRSNLIRPLLSCRKEENLAFLKARGLSYSHDSTNSESTFLRNKLRQHLLPKVADIFPGYRHSLENFIYKIRDIHDFLNQILSERITWESCPEGGYRIRLKNWHNLHRSLKLHLIYTLFNRISKQDEKKLPFRFLKPIINLDFKKNSHFEGYGLAIFVKEDYLFFRTDIVYNKKKGYLIENIGISGIEIKNSGFSLKLSEKHGKMEKVNSCHETITLKKDLICLPLIVRSRRAGDKIKLENFSKSLKKLWIEWGVPEMKKMMIPVIADRNGILAVVGYPFGYKNIVTCDHSTTKKDEKIILIKIEEDGVKQSG